MTDQRAGEVFRRASESIAVPTTPVDAVVADALAQRGRRRRRIGAGLAVAVVVVGALTWFTQREQAPSEDLPPAAVSRAPNPVEVAWYANGSLHLGQVAVAVPPLTDLIEINGGAVYADQDGTVAFVAADGERRLIGHKTADGPLVGSNEEGWAAWVDPGEDAPTLRVYDVSAGEPLDSRALPSPEVRPIAIDQHQVFYEEPDGTFAWTPGVDVPLRLVRDGLLDVASANRVYQLDGRIEIEQSFFSVSYVVRGTGALVSDTGVLVISKEPGPGVAEGRPFRPLVYDARSGDRTPSGVRADERAIDATFGHDNTLVYLVAQVTDLVGGSDIDGNVDPLLVLRTCALTDRRCTDVAPVQSGTDRPILAH